MFPETRYAREAASHIAYQALGNGPPDVVFLGSWFSHVEARWDVTVLADLMRRIASFGRMIHFDKRGTGLSGPVALQSLPTLEEWMDDLRAVLDAVESERRPSSRTSMVGLWRCFSHRPIRNAPAR